MTGRLGQLDSMYHRRISAAGLVAVLGLVLAVLIFPDVMILAPRPHVGMKGPLRVLPQIDIVTENEEETGRTAAPDAAPRADFEAIEIDYAFDPRVPEPVPEKSPNQPEMLETFEVVYSPADDRQDAIRTSSHPVLADTEYELVYMARPVYPREAVQKGIEGTIHTMVMVDERGRVSQAYVINPGRYPLLEDAVIEAVFQSLFRPYIVKGVPTPFWVRVPFQFRLVS